MAWACLASPGAAPRSIGGEPRARLDDTRVVLLLIVRFCAKVKDAQICFAPRQAHGRSMSLTCAAHPDRNKIKQIIAAFEISGLTLEQLTRQAAVIVVFCCAKKIIPMGI